MANSTISQIKVGNDTYDIKPAPTYQDTDTKVKQNNLASGERPILLASAVTPTTSAGEVYQNSGLQYNAGTGILTAKNGYKIQDGTSDEFLMANGSTSTLKPLTVSAIEGKDAGVTYENGKMTFIIPAGAKGSDGIGIGTVTATVTTAVSTATPIVTVSSVTSGDNKDISMAFTLPKGETGDTGVVSVVTAGSGNAVTTGSYNSATKTITLTKEATYLTNDSLSNYAQTSDLNNYIPLTGSTAIAGDLAPKNSQTYIGTFDVPWEWGCFNNAAVNYLTSTDQSTYKINVNSKYFNFLGSDGASLGTILSIGEGDASLIFKGSIVQNKYIKHQSVGSMTFCDSNFKFIGITGNKMEYASTQSFSDTDFDIYGQINIKTQAYTETNSIAMQNGHLAVKLHNNELCIGNLSSTNATNLYLNYRPITGCGTYSGLILCAGSSTSFATLKCGAITAPSVSESSDIRQKNIVGELPLDKCLELVDKCQTIIYTLKDQTEEQIGMIAQEIEKIFPEVVSTDEEGYKSLNYSRLIVICFRILKDLIKRVSDLENK